MSSAIKVVPREGMGYRAYRILPGILNELALLGIRPIFAKDATGDLLAVELPGGSRVGYGHYIVLLPEGITAYTNKEFHARYLIIHGQAISLGLQGGSAATWPPAA
jgi:hypothetical protein